MKTSDYRGILYNFANDYWKKNADLIPAFNYAIDRQAMIDAVLLGAGEVVDGVIDILNRPDYTTTSFDTDYIVTSSTSYLGRYGYLRVAYTF